jgi:8-oxo-dGTP pyrophosphatase MutT (NUDIX family)
MAAKAPTSGKRGARAPKRGPTPSRPTKRGPTPSRPIDRGRTPSPPISGDQAPQASSGGSAPRSARAPLAPRIPTAHHRSAGGLVVAGERILLISTQNGRRWQLPKGHIEPGESAEEAAVREVREETGVTGRVLAPLPSVEYWYVEKGQLRVHKKVDYFLLEYVSGNAAEFDAKEVSGAEWFGWEEGLARMSYENERRVARQAQEAAASLPSVAVERRGGQGG